MFRSEQITEIYIRSQKTDEHLKSKRFLAELVHSANLSKNINEHLLCKIPACFWLHDLCCKRPTPIYYLSHTEGRGLCNTASLWNVLLIAILEANAACRGWVFLHNSQSYLFSHIPRQAVQFVLLCNPATQHTDPVYWGNWGFNYQTKLISPLRHIRKNTIV